MKPIPLPHHREPLREVDAWEEGGFRYRLVDRGGVHRIEAWELYRWKTVESGALQILARRVAALLRSATADNVEELAARRKVAR